MLSSFARMPLLNRRRVHDVFVVAALLSAANATPYSYAGGLALFLAGMALHMWSKGVLTRNVQLCADGPYAICRHPFYLANAMLDVGVCVMSGAWLLVLVYPAAFYVAYAPTIREEERVVRRLHGRLHEAYCANTPALLPSLRGLLRGAKLHLSWQNLLRERELSRVARYASFPLLVLLSARLWQSQWRAVDATALALGAAVLGLRLLSQIAYNTLEGHKPDGALPALAMWLSRNGTALCAGLLLGVVLAWDPEVQDLLFVAGLVTFQIGCSSFRASTWTKGVPVAAKAAIVVLGLYWLAAAWAAPFAVALLLSEALDGHRERRRWTAPRVRLALASASCAMGLVVVSLTGGFAKSHFLAHVAATLRQHVRATDTVIVVADRDLAGLQARAHVDAIVQEDGIGQIEKLMLGKSRAVIVVEAEELPHLVVSLKRAVIRPLAEWWLGIEKFCALAVQWEPDDTRAGQPPKESPSCVPWEYYCGDRSTLNSRLPSASAC